MMFEQYVNFVKEAIAKPSNNLVYNPFFDSILLLVTFFLLSKLVVFASTKILLQFTKKTKTKIDDLIVSRINMPISIILLLIGVRLALLPLAIRQNILDILENIVGSLIILIVTYIVIVVVEIIIDNWLRNLAAKTESQFDDQFVPVLHRFSRIFIAIVGILFVLTAWGVQIGPLLTSLGIMGIAVAFALQTTLGNIFGGMSIIIDKSVKVGDKIKLDNETIGTVLDVGFRSTKILTFDNELVTIPSGKLAESKIINFVQPDPTVRVAVEFGVEYGSEPEKVRQVVLGTISKIPNILKNPVPKVLMIEMADFSLKFRALFWVATFDEKFETKAIATEKIYNDLRNSGIGIPFPTRTVYLKEK